MSILSLLKPKKKGDLLYHYPALAASLQPDDYLGKASLAGSAAKAALKEKKFEDAWRVYHEQKEFYKAYAENSDISAERALILDSTVSEHLASILRQQEKPREAFIHLIYWVAPSWEKAIRRHEEKLKKYFTLCQLSNTTIDEVKQFVESNWQHISLPMIEKQVEQWFEKG